MSSPSRKRTKQCAHSNLTTFSCLLCVPRADLPPQVGSSSSGASSLHHLLWFMEKRIQTKVNTLLSLPMKPNKYPSQGDLEKLGVWQEIDKQFYNGDWTYMLSIRDLYYHKLFIEFQKSQTALEVLRSCSLVWLGQGHCLALCWGSKTEVITFCLQALCSMIVIQCLESSLI